MSLHSVSSIFKIFIFFKYRLCRVSLRFLSIEYWFRLVTSDTGLPSVALLLKAYAKVEPLSTPYADGSSAAAFLASPLHL